MARSLAGVLLFLIAGGPAVLSARAQPAQSSTEWETGRAPAPGTLPDEWRYFNREVPDVAIETTAGTVRLSALWQRGPVLLTLVFTRCAGVCSPFLRSLRGADEALGAPLDVQRVVLSFDVRDTVEDMDRTAAHLGVANRPGWVFATAAPADVDRLARAFGFWFAWDASRQQFDHPAMIVGIRQGRVARLQVGGRVTAARLGEVVREARGQFVASYPLPGTARFRCFEYDPVTGNATLAPGVLVLLIPALVAGVVTAGLFRRPRSRPHL
jgi:cytochrome oxidase Cu insertion factor (SCO1/SenC/PrrC family)